MIGPPAGGSPCSRQTDVPSGSASWPGGGSPPSSRSSSRCSCGRPTRRIPRGLRGAGSTYSGGGGTADSNNRAIALSASIGNGESVVYYFDTESRRLLVYQYRGIVGHNKPLGSGDSGGVRLLAARHIDYDLKLESYRDLSEQTRNQLKDTFETAIGGEKDSGGLPTKTVEVPGGLR
jgi:hypothetical protein